MSHGSRYFKISQSFFSRGGTICLSDYCCWTASTRAGEPEKPILCRGRGLFDKIAWNSMKSSCSNWETEKSVVLHLIHFGSTSYQVQQLKDKIAEIPGAFWRFLCFEIGFLLSSLSQLSLRLHLTWVAWMFFPVDRHRVLRQMRQQNSNSKNSMSWKQKQHRQVVTCCAWFFRIQVTCNRKDTQESHHLEWSVWDVRKDSTKGGFFGEVEQLKDKLAEVEVGHRSVVWSDSVLSYCKKV